jgi:hypothetical protein
MRSCHRVYVCTISIKNALFINDVYNTCKWTSHTTCTSWFTHTIKWCHKTHQHTGIIYIHPASQKRAFPRLMWGRTSGRYILLGYSPCSINELLLSEGLFIFLLFQSQIYTYLTLNECIIIIIIIIYICIYWAFKNNISSGETITYCCTYYLFFIALFPSLLGSE